MSEDPFDLERFVAAQSGGVFEQALEELRAGRKTSHWMWFVFPQHRNLARSSTAKYFGLSGVNEVRAYAEHSILGGRLRACCEAVLPHLHVEPAATILGPVDALKLASSMDIFIAGVPDDRLFRDVRAAIR